MKRSTGNSLLVPGLTVIEQLKQTIFGSERDFKIPQYAKGQALGADDAHYLEHTGLFRAIPYLISEDLANGAVTAFAMGIRPYDEIEHRGALTAQKGCGAVVELYYERAYLQNVFERAVERHCPQGRSDLLSKFSDAVERSSSKPVNARGLKRLDGYGFDAMSV